MIDSLYKKKRFLKIIICFLSVIAVSVSSSFLQHKHHMIGMGIDRTIVFLLINAQIILIGFLMYLIIRNGLKIAFERWTGAPGASFRLKLAVSFIVLAVTPALFVFFTAGSFVIKSIDAWFDVRFDRALEAAVSLGRPALSGSVSTVISLIKDKDDAARLEDRLRAQHLRKKAAVYCLHPNQNPKKILRPELLYWRSIRAVNDRTTDKLYQYFLGQCSAVKTLKVFDFYGSTYIAKPTSKGLLIVALRYPQHLKQSLTSLQEVYYDYRALRSIRGPLLFSYFSVYLLFLVLILFIALWVAFYLAKSFTKPMQSLLNATRQIEQGAYPQPLDLKESGDFTHLAQGFNQMMSALEHAQKSLIHHNQRLLQILEHLSTGVVVINHWGRVVFSNDIARRLAHIITPSVCLQGAKLTNTLMHELGPIYAFVTAFIRSNRDIEQFQFDCTLGGAPKTFVVFMTYCDEFNNETGKSSLLVMLEDVTGVVHDSKLKAWQEVVKQVAHEIKNPLTPILLAAERLKKRYPEKKGDHVFIQSLDVIIRQVDVIRHLTQQFSRFGALPAAELVPCLLHQLVQDVAQLYLVSYPDLSVSVICDEQIVVFADPEKCRQVFVNLFDNSLRALTGMLKKEITITCLQKEDDVIEIIFSDTGPGVPPHLRQTLFLPYVSTEKKNMGLGLAIVRATLSSMNGSVELVDSEEGAVFRIVLKKASFNLQYEKNTKKKFDFFRSFF